MNVKMHQFIMQLPSYLYAGTCGINSHEHTIYTSYYGQMCVYYMGVLEIMVSWSMMVTTWRTSLAVWPYKIWLGCTSSIMYDSVQWLGHWYYTIGPSG